MPKLYCLVSALVAALPLAAKVELPDLGDGTYRNPVLFGDYSDPDAIGVDGDFWMTASSFACAPGLPLLHSRDLVNWQIVNYALPAVPPRDYYDAAPRHGKGVWAPSLRYHSGEYYIYWGDPDFGVFMTKTKDPRGQWSAPVLVMAAKGIIDTTPLWDDDGRLYLINAWAASRSGMNSVLTVRELNAEGTAPIAPPVLVYDANDGINHTMEGPKLYKRDGWYYIFAPAGGVATGWQVVMRSRNIYGPYEARTVMAQGATRINGPHQGAWVQTDTGEDWFLHFQDRGVYGRVVHLQPMQWHDGWPVIGTDADGDGCGEPVVCHKKPAVTAPSTYKGVPQTSDNFRSPALGLQWEWQANYTDLYGFTAPAGFMRLYGHIMAAAEQNMWNVPNMLLQKFPAEEFRATARLTASAKDGANATRSGLVVFGLDYAYLGLERTPQGFDLVAATCTDADRGTAEKRQLIAHLADTRTYAAGLQPNHECQLWLRVSVKKGGLCQFAYSADGKRFHDAGATFQARQGKWVGAKVGLFATTPAACHDRGWADCHEFVVE